VGAGVTFPPEPWRTADPREVYADGGPRIVVYSPSMGVTTADVWTSYESWSVHSDAGAHHQHPSSWHISVCADDPWPDGWWWMPLPREAP
jgi:hypothetical protein